MASTRSPPVARTRCSASRFISVTANLLKSPLHLLPEYRRLAHPIEQAKSLSEKESSSFFGRVFKAFQFRDFRLMWTGACTSQIGTQMQTAAQAWLVYDLSLIHI